VAYPRHILLDWSISGYDDDLFKVTARLRSLVQQETYRGVCTGHSSLEQKQERMKRRQLNLPGKERNLGCMSAPAGS
jgi:hypothetical protein